MKPRAAFILSSLLGLVLLSASATAQEPTPAQGPVPAPTPRDDDAQPATPASEDEAGNYTFVGSVELGVRALGVDGNREKYRADLNYGAGFRLFDSSFLVRAKEGQGGAFDTLVVNSSGFNADPHGSLRVNAQKARWYRFDMNYRRNRYDNRLQTFALGQHYRYTTHNLGDRDLRLLPTNRRIRFHVGYSFDRNRSDIPGGTTYDFARDEFPVLTDVRTRSDEVRAGVEGRVGALNLGFLAGVRRYRDDSTYFIDRVEPGNNRTNTSVLNTFRREMPGRGRSPFYRLSAQTNVARSVDLTARYTYTRSRYRFTLNETLTGVNASNQLIENNLTNFSGEIERPVHLADFGVTWQPTRKLRISDTFRYNTFRNEGDEVYNEMVFLRNRATGAAINPFPVVTNVPIERALRYRRMYNQIKVDYQAGPRFGFHLGHRISDRHIELERRGRILPTPVSATFFEEEDIDTQNNSFFGGLKARPSKQWSLHFDFERGEADHTFTRLDNLDSISFRVRSRWTPRRGLGFGLSFSSRDNDNPGVGVVDTTLIGNLDSTPFSVEIDSRNFSATADWAPEGGRYSLSGGYTYTYLRSDAEILFFRGATPNVIQGGRSIYNIRDSFFFFNTSVQLTRWVAGHAGYRIHRDAADEVATDPVAGLFARALPLRFQSPEVRLIFRLHNRLDWNIGYQYFEYKERLSDSQNYRAHLPYTSLRFYWGGGER